MLNIILILQWVLLLGMSLVLYAAVRQIGVLHQRIAPAGALTISQGISAGEHVPALSIQSLDGDDIALGGLDSSGRSTLIMFVAPDCPVCAVLIPAVKAIAKQEAKWLRVIFASDGNAADHRVFRRQKGLENFPYVVSMELGLVYQVGKLPFAVLLDENGIMLAQGLTNSREHIESLFEAKRLGVASIQEYLYPDGSTQPVET